MAERTVTSILADGIAPVGDTEGTRLSQVYGLEPQVAGRIAEVLGQPRVDIISDAPSKSDLLQFRPLVLTLSQIILSQGTETPLTICIDGPWGSGKTSMMKMVEAQAQAPNFPRLWLNAWNISDTTEFLMTVGTAIREEFRLHEEDAESLRYEIDDWMHSPTSAPAHS